MTSTRRFYFVRCNDGETFEDVSLETLGSLVRQKRIDRDTPILDQVSRETFFPDQHPWLNQKLASLRESDLLQDGDEQREGKPPRFFRWIERGHLLIAITAATIAALALIFSISTR